MKVLQKSVLALIAAVLLVPLAETGAEAQSSTEALRTAWEAPDIGGVWDFRTLTPLQRPDNHADQAVLSEEEVAEIEATTVQRAAEGPTCRARSR